MEQSPEEDEISFREFGIYFLGLRDGESVKLNELEREMPYNIETITEELEGFKQKSYIDSIHNKIVKPVDSDGFNEILSETVQDPVADEEYRLTREGREYLQEMGLGELTDNLEYVFQEREKSL